MASSPIYLDHAVNTERLEPGMRIAVLTHKSSYDMHVSRRDERGAVWFTVTSSNPKFPFDDNQELTISQSLIEQDDCLELFNSSGEWRTTPIRHLTLDHEPLF